ncbi:vWA domain-containing protein [Actinomycetospora termitidis]|uniref:VWA domain-containing protein n=1 Tax=Actinomycetospora termitidis TaxID=3053470 RepID=A0ABT7ME98_9PSEU|nr:vWA domain-containing protein [Actinomycetospora sp. Odt1-22]MDL5158985.1 VWA domain-containing protein [Actinomycetospora sp. Odt1-22]
MYTTSFSRRTPGCIVFLIDRSDSMRRAWPQGGTLATGAARALNRTIDNLVMMANPGGVRVRHYYDIGVFGYGMKSDRTEGVESAWAGDTLRGRGLVPVPEIADGWAREVEVPSTDAGAPAGRAKVWVDPLWGFRTPMCEAIAVAGEHVHEWVGRHRTSFPPIIINITDGIVTDRYQDTPLVDWAARLRSLATEDGPPLLFNIFISPDEEPPANFPASADGLPEPGPLLFGISSELPPTFVATAEKHETGFSVPEGGRAFSFNADFPTLVKFLTIGTRPDLGRR